MADIKTLLKLTEEARLRDQPFIDIIDAELITAIDAAMSSEIEYKVEYDINTVLITTDGPLQTQRIKNVIIDSLKSKGYRAAMTIIATVDTLVITWTINTLTTSL